MPGQALRARLLIASARLPRAPPKQVTGILRRKFTLCRRTKRTEADVLVRASAAGGLDLGLGDPDLTLGPGALGVVLGLL